MNSRSASLLGLTLIIFMTKIVLAHEPNKPPPLVLGPAVPSGMGMLIPVSLDTPLTDEELKKEFLRHTHKHTHTEFIEEDTRLRNRIRRLEFRLNKVIVMINQLMPLSIDASDRSTAAMQELLEIRAYIGMDK